jgi:pyruvate ferredoxin oxidoreductase gamma subunit
VLWHRADARAGPPLEHRPIVFETRIHGRGGQGVVTAAELLSLAAFDDGLHAQAFPSFGSERTGAPVVAFCRVDDRPIRTREPIAAPHALIVQDATLLHQVAVFAGLREDGLVLVNSHRTAAELGLADLAARVITVPASDFARAELGRPLPNAALLGGFAALSGVIGFEALARAIAESFPGPVADANIAAAGRARAHVELVSC